MKHPIRFIPVIPLLFLLIFTIQSNNSLHAQCTPGCITPGASTNLRLRFNTESMTDLVFGAYGSGLNYNVYWYQESNPLVCGFACGITSANYTITGLNTNTFYIVEVSGAVPSMSFYYWQNGGYAAARHTQLREVQQWGNIAFQNLSSAFRLNTLLDVTATDVPNLTGYPVVNLGLMFYYCSNLIGNSSFNSWNTSNVYNMGGMFGYTDYFNQPIGNWNTANVTDMGSMFFRAVSFNQPIGTWNTSNVVNMSFMFNGASLFNQDIGSWNVSNVIDMTGMFAGSNFNNGGSPSISSWNVSNVQSMRGMFGHTGCCGIGSPFNQPIGNWNVSNVVDMYGMFWGATQFNQDIGSWNVGNVTNMAYMFYNATQFNNGTNTNPINNWNTGSVTNMAYMFNSASNFNREIGAWNVSNVTNMTGMFAGSNFNNGGSPSINNWNVSNVQSMRGMFGHTGCCGIGSPFNQPIGNWNVSNVVDMYGMFWGATQFNQDIGSWNVGNVTNMAYMFYNATQFNNGTNTNPINNWNTGSVTNMVYMFNSASNFNREIGAWNVSNVTNMEGMFAGSNFNNGGSPSINNWNVSNVQSMRGMFGHTGCCGIGSPFNQPIGNWNVSNVVDMYGMFWGATQFNQDIGSWNVSNVTDMANMFRYATQFNNGTNTNPINNWNVSSVTNMYAMFYYANNFNRPIGNWNTGSVLDMQFMFQGAANFNQNIGTWPLHPSVFMNYMLDNPSGITCTTYEQILQGWATYAGANGIVLRTLGANGRMYSTAGVPARTSLLGLGWTIAGDVASPLTPAFAAIAPNNGTINLCQSNTLYTLPVNADQGYGGTWSPSNVIDLSNPANSGVYTFNPGIPCVNSYSVTINIVNPGVNIAQTPAGPICQGSPVNLQVNNGSSGSTYTWSDPGLSGATPTINPILNTTTYTVTVTNPVGCSGTVTASHTVNVVTPSMSGVSIAPNPSATICQGSSVSLQVLGGSGISNYTWNPNTLSGDNPTISPTLSGSYTVTVSNPASCAGTVSATTFINVVAPSSGLVNVTTSPSGNICIGSPVTLNVSGGSGSSTYAWSNGGLSGSNPSFTPGATDTYTVTVTNPAGCSGALTASVTVNVVTPPVSISPLPSGTVCQGTPVTLQVNGSSGLSTYTWSDVSLSGNSPTFTPTSSGTYTVTVTNPLGCSGTAAANINVNVVTSPGVAISPAPSSTICVGSNATLNVVGGNAGSSYTWSDPLLSGSSPSAAINTAGANTYTVTVTNPAACSGTATASVVITGVIPSVSIGASPSTTICAGNVVNLNVSGGGAGSTYSWSDPGLSGATPSFVLNSSNVYTVTVTNPAGCSGTAMANVSLTAVNTLGAGVGITASPSTNICAGNPVTLTVSGGGSGSSYSWSNGSLSGATPTFTPGATDTYTVTISNPTACSGTLTASIPVNVVNPAISISPSPSNTICQGSNVTLNVIGGGGSSTYTWSSGSLSGSSPTFTPTSSGTYTVTVTNPLGCSGTAAANVNVNVVSSPGVVISPSPSTTICVGSAAILNVVGGNSGSSYAWSDPLLSGSNPSATINTAGTNTYTVTVTNPAACSGTATASVVITGVTPSVSIGASPSTTICAGNVVNLNVSGGGVGSTYSWSDPSLSGSTPSFVLNSSNVYTVTVTNPAGCSGTAMANIPLTAVNTLGAGVGITASPSTNICAGNPVTLTVSGGGSGSSYSWSDGSLSGATPTFTPGATDTYTVTITNPTACSGTLTASIAVNVITPAVAINASPSSTVCQGSSVTLNVSGGGGSSTYTWSDGSLSGNSPNFVPVSSNTYTVTVTNPIGCSGSVTANVSITVNTPPVITSVSTTDVSNCGMIDGSITINASGNGVLQYSIDGGNAYVNNGGIFNNLAPGSYQVAVVDAAGCEVIGNIYTVNGVPLPPAPQAQNQYVICNGQTLGNLTVQPTYNGVITWYDDPGLTNIIGNGSSFNVNSLLQPGSNYFYATENVNGCEGASVTIEVIVNPGITATISQSDSLICPNSYVTLEVNLNQQQPQTQYAWNTGATSSTLQVNSAGTYTVTVNQLGCVTTASIQVNSFNPVLGMPHAFNDFGSTWINQNIQIPILANDSTNNSVVNIITPPSNGVLSYNNGVLLYSPSIGFYGVDSVQYTLCSNVCNMVCDTAWVIIDVNRINNFNIPGAITPNNDGKNDVWVIEGLEDYPDNEVKILNAWGDVVYTAAPYINNWSGECNNSLKLVGDRLPRGTYYYVIDLKDGVTPPIKGFVELSY